MADRKYAIWIDEENAEEVEEMLDAAGIMRYQDEFGR